MRLIGYGNPGRGDDGLGPAFTARIARADIPGLTVTTDYQLTVDHALLVSGAGQVVFVDALAGSEEPFRFAPVAPATTQDLTSHSLSPEAVLALSATLYGAAPKAYILGITGHEFGEVKEGLSAGAENNLRLAEKAFLKWLRTPAAAADMLGYADA